MTRALKVPCTYQGGKQRVASEIADLLLAEARDDSTTFYDLCCGSGAISVELVNRGVAPQQIVMLDNSSWGAFWNSIGTGRFNLQVLDGFIEQLPEDKRDIKRHMSELAAMPVFEHESELYPLLQSCSFGGKQIWLKDEKWQNAFFRDYWEPTETSVRRSPANPMQPKATELRARIVALQKSMLGVNCLRGDISLILEQDLNENSVFYVDPPYRGTTGYGYGFDLDDFISEFTEVIAAPLFVSESLPLEMGARKLNFGGANGGITGSRTKKHEEWLSRFKANPAYENG